MIETPVNMRRRNSAPVPSSRRWSSPSLLRIVQQRHNPYVGTFRHSPPSSYVSARERMMSKLAATKLFANSSSRKTVFVNDSRCCRGSSPMKNSPYVGSFRHAPPSWATATNASELYEIILQETLHLNNNNKNVKTLSSSSSSMEVLKNLYVSGHLRGGSPSYSNKRPCPYSTSSFPSNNHHHHHDFVSPMTLSLPLRRIVGWLLQPFHETMTPTIKYAPEFTNARRRVDDGDASSILTPSSDADDSRDDDLDDDDESSLSQDDYDDDDSRHHSHNHNDTGADRREMNESTSDENDFHLSILSSQAEAYYAHSLTKDILNDHRLDYTITQMDVIRMMRNASRHLDVDSILQLPVTTYRSKKKKPVLLNAGAKAITITNSSTTSSSNDESETEEMSWMLVHEDHDNKTPSSGGNNVKAPDALPHIQEASDADVCVICLEHFVDGDRVRVLPCTHSFHVGCIDRWLSGSHSFDDCVTSGCPTCKKRPVEELEEDGADYTVDPGNSVPSWAFSRIGDALARNLSG